MLKGMLRTLETRSPRLQLELHGFVAARESLSLLDACGYRFLVPGTDRCRRDAQDVLDSQGDSVYQIAALPAGDDALKGSAPD